MCKNVVIYKQLVEERQLVCTHLGHSQIEDPLPFKLYSPLISIPKYKMLYMIYMVKGHLTGCSLPGAVLLNFLFSY